MKQPVKSTLTLTKHYAAIGKVYETIYKTVANKVKVYASYELQRHCVGHPGHNCTVDTDRVKTGTSKLRHNNEMFTRPCCEDMKTTKMVNVSSVQLMK